MTKEHEMCIAIYRRIQSQQGVPPTCRSCELDDKPIHQCVIAPKTKYVSSDSSHSGHKIFRHADCYERLWITLPTK